MEGKYINLITYKMNGEPMTTPVWFVEKNEKMFVASTQRRYKIKRIMNNPEVKVAPASFRGKAKGEYIDGVARILSDDESKSIPEIFRKKYRMFKMMYREDREGEKKSIFIEISF
ncbi:MAG: PPOX class F420-dependent oxidoreductase [Promethearchaeota archaeon]|jgi:PPOX class probable F420-dependent enzyme